MNSASELIKNVVETLGILCAGAWAISTFWYQDRYVPSKLPVQLDVSTELSDIGRKNGLHALKAHVKLKNSGRRTVYSVASWYNVEAFKIDPALKGPAADTEYYVGVVKEALPKPGTAYSPGRHRRFTVSRTRWFAPMGLCWPLATGSTHPRKRLETSFCMCQTTPTRYASPLQSRSRPRRVRTPRNGKSTLGRSFQPTLSARRNARPSSFPPRRLNSRFGKPGSEVVTVGTSPGFN
jgi:hypothetical protein